MVLLLLVCTDVFMNEHIVQVTEFLFLSSTQLPLKGQHLVDLLLLHLLYLQEQQTQKAISSNW